MKFEKYYPTVISALLVIVFGCFRFTPKIDGFEKVLDGVISFSSIALGFLGALLAIILSISKSNVIQHLYSYMAQSGGDGRKILFGYFQRGLLTGFAVVILSIGMYVISKQTLNMYFIGISYLWLFLVFYFVLSSYRIVSVLMYTLFKHESENEPYRPETVTEETEALRQRLIREREE
ncbi:MULTISPECIES: hypothetical protein [Bacillus cereus group]|uniref:hypothetical protein n=1 Tax=Bacillus cereus group TaxID=86661 RepID=UPI0005CAD70C|nr:hypothetical protein [Bacillus cereus]MBJ6721084.1 hypothetical protein [Bacillus sp. PR5]KIZ30620.1 hypothetical protein SK30_09300 [Bacillus cereus]MBM6766532.1 hypothetical protein [Bacillus cereus]MEB9973806.1 hypothetical protein [Bacillus cereus]PER83096.1 hypothetical protein CN487_06690 [Bacillus cereus]